MNIPLSLYFDIDPQYVFLNILLDNDWKECPERHIRYSLKYNKDKQLDEVKNMYMCHLSDAEIRILINGESISEIRKSVNKNKLVDIIQNNILWETDIVVSKLTWKNWLKYKSRKGLF